MYDQLKENGKSCAQNLLLGRNLSFSSSCGNIFQTRLKFTLKLLEAVTKTKTKFSEFLSNRLRL